MTQKNQHRTQKRGASLIEMLLVMAIVGILLRLISINLFRSQEATSMSTTRDAVISDLREQQLRAMTGKTNAAGVGVDFSVRIESARYILYPGSVYSGSGSENVIVALDPVYTLTTTFPSGTVTFSRPSGDIKNFTAGQNTITLTNTQTGGQIVCTLNEYGVVFIQ